MYLSHESAVKFCSGLSSTNLGKSYSCAWDQLVVWLGVGWSWLASAEMTCLCSVWSLTMQQASLGLFSQWKQGSKIQGRSPRDLLRPRLGTDSPSFSLHSSCHRNHKPARSKKWGNKSFLEGQKIYIAKYINTESSSIGASNAVNLLESDLFTADVYGTGTQEPGTMKGIQPIGS